MGLPATTLSIAFDPHAISVGIFQDLIPSITLTLGFEAIVKATRMDSVAAKASVEGSMNPRLKSARLDDCAFRPLTLPLSLDARVLSVTAPFPPVTWTAGFTFGAEPVADLDIADHGPATLTIGGHVEASASYNNPHLNALDVARQVYYLWGFQTKDIQKIGIGLDSITMWVNSALQMIFSRADKLEFFNRETITEQVTTSGRLVLPSSIQRIQGAVRLSDTKKSLLPLSSQTELEQFERRFLDDASTPPARPLAYYLDSQRVDAADSVKLTLCLVPAPTSNLDIIFEVTKQPPRYSDSDMILGRILEIPHILVETILLPLVKKWASADPMMTASSRTALQPQIDQQYRIAMESLGLADSAAPQVTGSKPKEAVKAEQ